MVDTHPSNIIESYFNRGCIHFTVSHTLDVTDSYPFGLMMTSAKVTYPMFTNWEYSQL